MANNRHYWAKNGAFFSIFFMRRILIVVQSLSVRYCYQPISGLFEYQDYSNTRLSGRPYRRLLFYQYAALIYWLAAAGVSIVPSGALRTGNKASTQCVDPRYQPTAKIGSVPTQASQTTGWCLHRNQTQDLDGSQSGQKHIPKSKTQQ